MKKPEVVKLKGEKRETGKKTSGQLRTSMRVPSVLYGPKVKDNVHFSIDEIDLEKLLSATQTSLQDLAIDETSYQTILKKVEFDPVSDRPVHADFYVLDEKHPVILNIPIRLKGTAIGVTDGGGRVFQPLRILRIKVLPDQIPAVFEVDITNLEIGDSIHITDLDLEGIIPLDDPSRTIVTVAPPKAEELFKPAEPEVDEDLEVELDEDGEPIEGEAEGEAGDEAKESPEDSDDTPKE